MSGRRRSVKSVRLVKMTAGSSVWPESEYVTKESTLASTGSESATALFAARTSSRLRMKRISFCRYSPMRARNGTSHAKNLMIFIPPSSSCSSFARLSVQTMLRFRIANSDFITFVCTGVTSTKKPKPASALGPSWTSRMMRHTIICRHRQPPLSHAVLAKPTWIGADQLMWKKPQQKSIRDTSVEMWLTSLPFVSVLRARLVRRSERR
jgi:hypothetical protein